MVKQLGVVLRSYGQRCRTLIAGTFVAGGLLQVVVSLAVAPRRHSVETSLPFIAMGLVFIGMQLWTQLREQLLSPRRFTWPGYIAPHVTVFAIFAILIAVVWPAALTIISGGKGLSLVVLVLAMFTLVGWCIVSLSPALMMLAAAAYVGICYSSMTRSVLTVLDAHPHITLSGLIGSLVIAAAGVVRLIRMDETSTAYNRKISTDNASILPRMTGQMSDPRLKLSKLQLWSLPPIETILWKPGGQWRRSQRFRNMRKSKVSLVGLFAIVIFLPKLLVTRQTFGLQGPSSQAFATENPLCVVLFLTGGVVAVGWMQRWRYLDMEFVRPIARRTLLKDLALAISFETAQCWLALMAVATGVWLLEGGFPEHLKLFLQIAALSFATHCFQLSLSLRVMPFRSLGGVLLAQMASGLMGSAVFIACVFSTASASFAVGASTILLLAAVGLLPSVVRRWEVADLG